VRPHPHRSGSPGPPRPPSRQRQRRSPDQDAFHRRVLPPPKRSPRSRVTTLDVRTWGSRGARHRYRCSRAGGFRHRDPASGALSPPEPPRTGARELDPSPFGMDQAPLVDFCNQHDRGHTHRTARTPFHGWCRLAGSPRPASSRLPVTVSLFAGETGAPFRCDDGRQSRFHGSGAGVLSPPMRLGAARSPLRAVTRDASLTPTRSARTPLVVEPRQRRVETPALPGAAPVRERRP